MMTGNWTVYCRDTFDGTTWNESFDTEAGARSYALKTAGNMLTCHIDNPQGKLVGREGQY